MNNDLFGFKRGDEVIYTPPAEGSQRERGFVTSVRGDFCDCRFFKPGTNELRTKANSERVYAQHLRHSKFSEKAGAEIVLTLLRELHYDLSGD